MATIPTSELDVAISFLDADERLALEISDKLRERMSVFVSTERQAELAGNDGVEKFSEVFRRRARLVVILFRDRWGHSKWTRVEETAIKARMFELGWISFLLVRLDDAPLPIWVPPTSIWYGYEHFGLEPLVAAIDNRFQEIGGTIREESVVEQAARIAREAVSERDRSARLEGDRGPELARAEVETLFGILERTVAEAAKEAPVLGLRWDRKKRALAAVVQSHRASIAIAWSCPYINSLNDARLAMREYSGRYSFDGWSLPSHGPELINESGASFDLDASGCAVWREDDDESRSYSSEQLANACLKRLLASIQSPRGS